MIPHDHTNNNFKKFQIIKLISTNQKYMITAKIPNIIIKKNYSLNI